MLVAEWIFYIVIKFVIIWNVKDHEIKSGSSLIRTKSQLRVASEIWQRGRCDGRLEGRGDGVVVFACPPLRESHQPVCGRKPRLRGEHDSARPQTGPCPHLAILPGFSCHLHFTVNLFCHSFQKDILCPPMSSSVDSHPVTIIKMPGVDHWTLQKYLCFIYTSKIEFTSLDDIWETLRSEIIYLRTKCKI